MHSNGVQKTWTNIGMVPMGLRSCCAVSPRSFKEGKDMKTKTMFVMLPTLLLACCGENTVRVSDQVKRSPNEVDTNAPISRPYFKRRPTPTPVPQQKQKQQQQQRPEFYRCRCPEKGVTVCSQEEILNGHCYIVYGG
jgi:hypothetical protein